jgi:hypothetical protein
VALSSIGDRRLCSALLPDVARRRLRAAPPFRFCRLLACAIVLSLAIGAATHQLWDALTHEESALLRPLPWLRMPVVASDSAD